MMGKIKKKKNLLLSHLGAGWCILPGVSAGIITLLITVLVHAGCMVHAPHRTPTEGYPGKPIKTSLDDLQDKKRREEVKKSSIERHFETVEIELYRDHANNAPAYIRTAFKELPGEIKKKEVGVNVEFTVAAIEFDDQGQFWSRGQYEQVIEDIKAQYNDNDALQVVVFVTGWKHSAAICDKYLTCFRTMLAYLAAVEVVDKKRPVYGVYIGWRGASLNVGVPILKELVNQFSYWDRKDTAHRIGAGDCVELLATLDALHRKKRTGPELQNKLTRLTIMGHSMGGAIVFSAIANTLKDRLARFVLSGNPESRGLFAGIGTLTILINPAIEASLYQGIHRMLSHNPGIFMEDNPFVLVTVTSEKDCPNRFFFPIGQAIGTLFQHTRSKKQHKQVLTTIGHYKPFHTHYLDFSDSGAPPTLEKGKAKCSCPFGSIIRKAAARTYQKMQDLEQRGVRRFVRSREVEDTYGRTKLVKKGEGPAADSPFIVALANRRVVGGHSKIWSLPFMEFISELIARNDEQIKLNDQDN